MSDRRGGLAARLGRAAVPASILAAILAALPPASARTDPAPGTTMQAERVLAAADAPLDAFSEGLVRMKLVVEEKPGKSDASELDLLIRSGVDSLAVIREGKQKGRRILTTGDGVWLIVPGSSRAIPVTSNQRLMGAASFGDIARLRFASAYDGTIRPEREDVPGPSGPVPCRVLDLKAKKAGAAFPAGTLWTGVEDGLPRKLRLALASGKEAREILYTSWLPAESAGRGAPRLGSLEIRDLLSKSGRVLVEFRDYEPKTLDAALFTPAGARSLP